MKTNVLIMIIFLSIKGFSQDSLTTTKNLTKPENKYSQDRETTSKVSTKTAWLLTSNFTVPTVTFQPLLKEFRTKPENIDKARGNLSFFNSVGAGISVSRANFKLLSSAEDTTGTDINNQIGFQFGFLFSRSATGTEDKNRFALQMGISILDFQIGFGKEFINVPQNYNSKFITISYGIPISKFTKKTAFVFKNRDGGINGKLSKINKGFSI